MLAPRGNLLPQHGSKSINNVYSTHLHPPPNHQPVPSLVALSIIGIAALRDAVDNSDECFALLQDLYIVLEPDMVRRAFEHSRGRTSLDWVHKCDEVSAWSNEGTHLVTPRDTEVWWDGDEESVFCTLCYSESKEYWRRTYSHTLGRTCPPWCT